VVYLGSLSKTAFPGVRIGYSVADQPVAGPDGTRTLLADELAKVKSMVTVNTSPLAQAVAGGLLLEHDCGLVAANRREIAVYRRNRTVLRRGLDRELGRFADAGVSWSAPAGGFFAVVRVPFAADAAALAHSALRHGVLWTRMGDFYQGDGGTHELRLSCSALSEDHITDGVARLARFVADGVENGQWGQR